MRVALGEVLFRRGKIPEAEQEWVNVVNQGYPVARAFWGLSRVRTALSLYAQAKDMLDMAHELDPTDSDIQKYRISSLSRAEQIQYWENYLAQPTLTSRVGAGCPSILPCRPTVSFFTTGIPVPSLCTYRIGRASPPATGRSSCTACCLSFCSHCAISAPIPSAARSTDLAVTSQPPRTFLCSRPTS